MRKLHLLMALFMLSLLVIAGCNVTGKATAGELDTFAQCVTDSGAVFYGAFWCPHCNYQKDLFGDSADLIDYVECSTPDKRGQTAVCQAAGIEAYPTWILGDGTQLTGAVELNRLSALTGCPL